MLLTNGKIAFELLKTQVSQMLENQYEFLGFFAGEGGDTAHLPHT
jgi:hypothetical protein